MLTGHGFLGQGNKKGKIIWNAALISSGGSLFLWGG